MSNGIHLEESHGRTRIVVRADEVLPLPSEDAAPTGPTPPDPVELSAIRRTAGRKGLESRWQKPSDGKRDGKTGKKAGKRSAAVKRRQQLKKRAEGIATMSPATVPTWMRPHVEAAAPYIVALLGMLDGKSVLYRLAGDTADAHVLFRATLALALVADDTKQRVALMSEARAWFREHRASMATLSALTGGMKLPTPGDPLAAHRRTREVA